MTTSMSRRGCTILLTGLSGAGKSTLAREMERRLVADVQREVTVLDGDEIRALLSPDLGYRREDRTLHCRRVGFIAGEVARHGGIAVCALIAPYEEAREEIRSRATLHGGAFFLVHVATPLEVCAARDAKGLYARSNAGVVTNLTGVGDAYEPPANADLIVDMTSVPAAAAACTIVEQLTTRGVVTPGAVLAGGATGAGPFATSM